MGSFSFSEVLSSCLDDLTGFRADAAQEDDVTVLAVRRAGR